VKALPSLILRATWLTLVSKETTDRTQGSTEE
jgi:hypothetical protein